MMKTIMAIFLVILIPASIQAQKKDKQLVQLSGVAISADSMMAIPYVHISVKGTYRSAVARLDGFFSFADAEGDTLVFSSIGYYPSYYVIPINAEDNKVSIVQIMNKRDYRFNDVVIYPWGDKRSFNYVFAHTRIPKNLEEIAEANNNNQLLMALGIAVPSDGMESTERYLQYHAASFYYYDMQPTPHNLINPLAWAELVKSIRRGDFKRKPAVPVPFSNY
jgi:hypothetical protein